MLPKGENTIGLNIGWGALTKEHKKLYKAGKNWLTATITIAAVTLMSGLTANSIHADSTSTTTPVVNVETTQQSQQNIKQQEAATSLN